MAHQQTQAHRDLVHRAVDAYKTAAQLLEGAGGPDASAAILARFGPGRSPLKELLQLRELLRETQADTLAALLQLLADVQVIPWVARLLSAVLCCAAVGTSAGNALHGGMMHVTTLSLQLGAIADAAMRTPAACALAEQMASPSVLAAVAAAARFVPDCVPGWSSDAEVTTDEDLQATGAEVLRNCASVVVGTLCICDPSQLIAFSHGMVNWPKTPEQEAHLEARRHAAEDQPIVAAPAAVAASAYLQRALAAVRDSGVLADLCEAVLAAPACSPLARNPNAAYYAQEMARAQWDLGVVLQHVGMLCTWHCGAWAMDVMAAPSVVRFRMEGLAQVAEAALEQHQQQRHREATASRSSGGDGGGCASSGSVWPLLQADVARPLMDRHHSSLTELYVDVVLSAVKAFCPTFWGKAVFPATVCSGAAAWDPAAAAQRIFPQREQAAALLSHACAAVCRVLEGPTDPHAAGSEEAETHEVARTLGATKGICSALSALLCGAPPGEAAACMPDVLAAHAWHVRAAVSCEGLPKDTPPAHVAPAVEMLANLLALSAAAPGERPSVQQSGEGWGRLGADVQAACTRALLPTRLMASLDAALRCLAASEPSGDIFLAALAGAGVVRALLPALLRTRLLPSAAGAAAVQGTAGDGEWRPQDELGVLATAAKLARREAVRLLAAAADQLQLIRAGGSRALMPFEKDTYGLMELIVQTCVWPHCLPQLLLELDAARAQAEASTDSGSASNSSDSAAGGAQQRAALLSEACRAVADAITLCGCSLLELLAAFLPVVEGSIWLRGANAATAPDVRKSAFILADVSRFAAAAVTVLPPSVLLASASDPRRLLAAAGRLARLHRQRQDALDEATPSVPQVTMGLAEAIAHLSADEDSLAAWVPGWLWAEPPPAGADAEASEWYLNRENLAALTDAPDEPPPGPVVVVRTAASAAALGGRPWAEHAQCKREVAALVRSLFSDRLDGAFRVRAAITAARARAGAPPWPPRLLKLCANPRCGNFAGACEADLKLKLCSGCRTYRYCSAACSKAHWPQHKAECKRLAAAAAAQSGAGAAAPGPQAAEAVAPSAAAAASGVASTPAAGGEGDESSRPLGQA